MSHRSVNYIFFGYRNLQGLQRHLQEPVESIQILAMSLPEEAQVELRREFGDKLSFVEQFEDLEKHDFMRGFLLTDLKSMEDAFYNWSGRQDFPFVVTVKESHRASIQKQNDLQEFHPNIDLLLRELIV